MLQGCEEGAEDLAGFGERRRRERGRSARQRLRRHPHAASVSIQCQVRRARARLPCKLRPGRAAGVLSNLSANEYSLINFATQSWFDPRPLSCALTVFMLRPCVRASSARGHGRCAFPRCTRRLGAAYKGVRWPVVDTTPLMQSPLCSRAAAWPSLRLPGEARLVPVDDVSACARVQLAHRSQVRRRFTVHERMAIGLGCSWGPGPS